MNQESLLDVLRRKLDELQKEEAISADPSLKFQLQEQIKDVQSRIDQANQASAHSGGAANEIAVVPKGLRYFDQRDAGFFLQLLPGPYREDGLPERRGGEVG